MSFGLCNAPATFMRLMNDVLHPFIDAFVIMYLDDILIFNNTWKEHILHVMPSTRDIKEELIGCKFQEV
jgi:hypothetical protein